MNNRAALCERHANQIVGAGVAPDDLECSRIWWKGSLGESLTCDVVGNPSAVSDYLLDRHGVRWPASPVPLREREQ